MPGGDARLTGAGGPLFRLDAQAAIVTGASEGLGRIMAGGLAEAGCGLVLTARTADRLADATREITAAGGRAIAVPGDVTDPAHTDALADACRETYGRLDGLVLNAGTATMSPAEAENMAEFTRVMDVNLTAVMRLAAAGASAMIDAGTGGWMITMSSILGRRAGTGGGVAAYSASKAAVEQLTRELARQWAPHGIRVNCIAPGFFPTALNAPMVASPERLAAMLARAPMGRAGEPADITGVAVFLASPASRFVTGHVMACDGGMEVW